MLFGVIIVLGSSGKVITFDGSFPLILDRDDTFKSKIFSLLLDWKHSLQKTPVKDCFL